MLRVLLYSARGEPIFGEFEPESLEPYRRTLVGFTAREKLSGNLDRDSDERPSSTVDLGEAEGVWVEGEEAEEEEDE